MVKKSLVLGVSLLLLQQVDGSAQTPHADVYVPSRPETIAWGAFPIDRAPVVT